MSHYQSFPDSQGASRSLEKLKALRLPELKGKSFLDVGCNEGFFCGFAEYVGARRSVGIDHSKVFIDHARERFPGCEFYHQSWDHIPGKPFDVILLASAIHYAEDQPALIRHLVEHLSEDGILVIELGIVSSPKADWFKIQRGIDERYFASMPMLGMILEPYAWKWLGPSVDQAGDPVKRHVIHVSRRKPLVYLLMMPPGYGKSSISTRAFASGMVPVVSGDGILLQMTKSKDFGTPRLRKLVAETFTPFTIDQTVKAIFKDGLEADLVDAWIQASGGNDFAMEGYIPEKAQNKVRQELKRRGYLPVELTWDQPGLLPMSSTEAERRAMDYFASLPSNDGGHQEGPENGFMPCGFVEDIQTSTETIEITGWAFDTRGRQPPSLIVQIGQAIHFVDNPDQIYRRDVCEAHRLPGPFVGFRLQLDFKDFSLESAPRLDDVKVMLPSGLPLNISRRLQNLKQNTGDAVNPDRARVNDG
jgi:SAM-dependent methyltransferase